MAVFRMLLVFAGLWVAAGVIAYLLTGRKIWLNIAMTSLSIALIGGLVFFGVLIVERLAE